MKIVIIMIATLSTLLLASGKVALENQFYLESHTNEPTLSLSVYEPLLLGISYDMWSGVSHRTEGGDYSFVSKHDLEKNFGDDLKVFAGYTYRHKRLMQSDLHVGASYKLW